MAECKALPASLKPRVALVLALAAGGAAAMSPALAGSAGASRLAIGVIAPALLGGILIATRGVVRAACVFGCWSFTCIALVRSWHSDRDSQWLARLGVIAIVVAVLFAVIALLVHRTLHSMQEPRHDGFERQLIAGSLWLAVLTGCSILLCTVLDQLGIRLERGVLAWMAKTSALGVGGAFALISLREIGRKRPVRAVGNGVDNPNQGALRRRRIAATVLALVHGVGASALTVGYALPGTL